MAVTVLAAALCCGCGSTAPVATSPARPIGPLPLATSVTSGQASWAVLPMGAPSGPNLFWQLFLLRAGSSQWTLATPPDVATNGAIALAGQAGPALLIGIHPSLYLGFSPISSTSNYGGKWHSSAPAPGLASVPDALAAAPGNQQLIALDRASTVEVTKPHGQSWTTLATEHSIARTAAGQNCGLTMLTAVSYARPAEPLVAGDCSRPGHAGIFAFAAGTWQAAGPELPASLAGQPIQVLRLTSTSSGDLALLLAGRAKSAVLLAAWLTGDRHWAVSSPVSLASATIAATASGSDGSAGVALTGSHALVIAGQGSQWQQTPALPGGRDVTLAILAAGEVDALSAAGGKLTSWQWQAGGTTWTKTQVMKVPIQYGSSS
jgi:hypothetical protein